MAAGGGGAGWERRRGDGRGEGIRARVGGGLAGKAHGLVQAGQDGTVRVGESRANAEMRCGAGNLVAPAFGVETDGVLSPTPLTTTPTTLHLIWG